jgi:sugar porter (SP) family MFS transporter
MINTAPGIVNIIYSFFIAPLVNDWLGRRRSIFLAAAFNVAGALVMAFSPNVAAFMVSKAIITISVSQGSNSGPLLVSELALPRIRGRLISFWQMFWSFGALEAAGVCLGTSYYPSLGNWQWKIPALLQLVTPIMICVSVLFCPESPRWLVAQGRVEDARAALARVRPADDVDDELREIEGAVIYEKEITKGRYKQWFVNKSYARRLILVFGLYLGQQLGGQGVLTQYSGIVYQTVFHSSTTDILLNFLNWILAVLYVLPATFFVDKVGRRTLLLIGAAGQALSMFLVATVVTQTPKAHGTFTYSVGIAAVLFVFLYNLFYQASWGCSTWVVATEVFPLNVRAQGIAISSTVEGAVMTGLGFAFPTFLANAGFYAFYFFMGVNIICFLGVFFFLPETKGRTLEQMDHLFGGEDHGVAGQLLLDQKESDKNVHVEHIEDA